MRRFLSPSDAVALSRCRYLEFNMLNGHLYRLCKDLQTDALAVLEINPVNRWYKLYVLHDINVMEDIVAFIPANRAPYLLFAQDSVKVQCCQKSIEQHFFFHFSPKFFLRKTQSTDSRPFKVFWQPWAKVKTTGYGPAAAALAGILLAVLFLGIHYQEFCYRLVVDSWEIYKTRKELGRFGFAS
jgi:hypothetical protein